MQRVERTRKKIFFSFLSLSRMKTRSLFSLSFRSRDITYIQHYLTVFLVELVVAAAVVVVVVVVVEDLAVVVEDMDNVDFFEDVNELMNNLNVENRKGLVDDELNFHRFVELVLFQHYFQHMLNLQIRNADASSNPQLRSTTLLRIIFVMLLLDEHRSVPWTIERERERGKKEKREKAVGVPLAATKFPVAMADITSIGRGLSFLFFFFPSF